MRTLKLLRRLLLSLTLPLASYASISPPISPRSVAPPRISPVPILSICLPSCTEGLTRLRATSRSTLAGSALLVQPANGFTTDYSTVGEGRAVLKPCP